MENKIIKPTEKELLQIMAYLDIIDGYDTILDRLAQRYSTQRKNMFTFVKTNYPEVKNKAFAIENKTGNIIIHNAIEDDEND